VSATIATSWIASPAALSELADAATDYGGNYSHTRATPADAPEQGAYDASKVIARQMAFINSRGQCRGCRAGQEPGARARQARAHRGAQSRAARITVRKATGRRAPERVLTVDGVSKSFDAAAVLNGCREASIVAIACPVGPMAPAIDAAAPGRGIDSRIGGRG